MDALQSAVASKRLGQLFSLRDSQTSSPGKVQDICSALRYQHGPRWQTRNIFMAFGGSMSHGYGHRPYYKATDSDVVPLWQHGPGYRCGLWRQHSLHTSGFLVTLLAQFRLSSLCPHSFSVLFSFSPFCHILVYLSGAWASGVFHPTYATWLQVWVLWVSSCYR